MLKKHELKTEKVIEKYYGLFELDRELTSEEKHFRKYLELDLAKALLEDFNEETIYKLAKTLLLYIEGKS